LEIGTSIWTSAELKDKVPTNGWNWISTMEHFEYPAFKEARHVNLQSEVITEDIKNVIQGDCLVMILKLLNVSSFEFDLKTIKCKNPYFFYCYEESGRTWPGKLKKLILKYGLRISISVYDDGTLLWAAFFAFISGIYIE